MHIDPKELIFAIINFLVLVLILYKFLYKPVLKALDKRKESISSAMEGAAAARSQAEQTKAELQAEIVNARNSADALIEAAKKSGEIVKNEIIAQAKADAQNIADKARAEIEREKQDAIKELKKEVAALAVLGAAKVLRGEVDEQTQKNLMDKYIEEVGHIQ